MMSVTIGDILEFTKDREAFRSFSAGEGDGNLIEISNSFFSVFENDHSNHAFVILDENEEPIARLTSEELFQGFQHVRGMLKEDTGG